MSVRHPCLEFDEEQDLSQTKEAEACMATPLT